MRAALAATCAAASIGAQAQAQAQSGSSTAFCDRTPTRTASQQDRILRYAAVVREQLARTDGGAALVSRSGLDLSRFAIRYSHAAVAWRKDDGGWSARQLYYACEERRPRLYDQGLAGFVLGIDDPDLGYVSIVRLPAAAAATLRQAALDAPVAAHLLAARYSADAYPYSVAYQNCNQWVAELLAVAWGGVADGTDLRVRAQGWLRDAGYAPAPVRVAPWLMMGSFFVPYVHLDDHPEEDRAALALRVSLPATVEEFVQARWPRSERIEVCHDARQVVVHRGWTPVREGCRAGDGDEVLPFD